MAIIDFKSTTIAHAFILNALTEAIAVVVTLVVATNDKVTKQEVFFLFIKTLFIYILVYSVMFIIFGYGSGMLGK